MNHLVALTILICMIGFNCEVHNEVNKINRVGFLARPIGARMLSSKRSSFGQNHHFQQQTHNLNANVMNNRAVESVTQSMQNSFQASRSMNNQMTNIQPVNQFGQINQQQNQFGQMNQQPNQFSQMNQQPNQFGQMNQQPNQFSQMNQQPNQMNQMRTMDQTPIQMNQMGHAQLPNQRISNQIVQQQMPIQTQSLCSNANIGDLIPHPTNQTQFVICYSQEEFTVMDCPEHLVYNRVLQRCDHELMPSQNQCESMPCMNNGKCVNIPDKFTFICECSSGFTGQMCEKSNTCASKTCGTSDGVCIELPAGSPIPNVCKCNSGTAFGLTCTQGLEMNPCMQPNANNVRFPTRLSQSVYVQCQGTRPHFMFCQHGLVYSPSRQMCDWSL